MDSKTDNYRRVGKNNNLIPINELPQERQNEIRAKSGPAAAKACKEKRQVKELLHELLYSEFSGDDKIKDILDRKGAAMNEVNGLLYQMMRRAGRSSTMADLLFRLHGDLQDGTNVNVNVINQMSDEQIQSELDKIGGGGGCINVTPEPPKIE